MKKQKSGKKINNQGAALVTVIVVITFISILATVVLYSSGMNFTMKTTDIKTKVNFYDAETAMEQLKSYFAGEASKAFETAYYDTLKNYGNWGNGNGRESHFKSAFFSALQSNFSKELTDSHLSITDFINSKVSAEYAGTITVTGTGYDVSTIGDGYVLFKGVVMEYTKDGYTTRISTDFLINVPDQNWAAEYSEKASLPSSDDILNKDLEMTEFVKYYNWTKK